MLTLLQAVTGYVLSIRSNYIKPFVVKALQFFLNKNLKLVLVLLKSKCGF